MRLWIKNFINPRMRIITWNINGIRSFKNFKDTFENLNADIICFQETKISRNQLEEKIAFIDGYYSFFSCPKYKSGYSGVATYAKNEFKPLEVFEKFFPDKNSNLFTSNELNDLENEGRTLITKHQFKSKEQTFYIYIINTYSPRYDPEREERIKYKLNYHRLMEEKIRNILSDPKNHVLVLGDLNISHKRIDHCEPDEDFEKCIYRIWLSNILNSSKNLQTLNRHSHQNNERSKAIENLSFQESSISNTFNNSLTYKAMPNKCKDAIDQNYENDMQRDFFLVDTFRYCYPNAVNAFTCWNTKIGARETNFGTRIDYVLCDFFLLQYINDCEILKDIQGSDHCPVLLKLKDIEPIASPSLPDFCTQNWPEFGIGKQSLIVKFLTKKKELIQDNCNNDDKEKQLLNTKSASQVKKNKQDKTQSLLTNYLISTSSVNSSENNNIELINKSLYNEPNKLNNNMEAKNAETKLVWKKLLPGLPKVPYCKHGVEAKLQTVSKLGPNKGKQFWCCSKSVGFKTDPNSRCDFFKWVTRS